MWGVGGAVYCCFVEMCFVQCHFEHHLTTLTTWTAKGATVPSAASCQCIIQIVVHCVPFVRRSIVSVRKLSLIWNVKERVVWWWCAS